MAEPGGAATELRKPRLVNRLFYRVMTGLLRRPILRYFMLEPRNADSVPRAGAGIILANHNNLFDVIWLYAPKKSPWALE